MKVILRIFGFLLVFSVFSACVPEGLTRTWQNPNLPAEKFKNLMVMGLVNNPTVRSQVEQEVVYAAVNFKLGAGDGMSMFPPELGKPFDDVERVKTRLRNNNYDAILTVTIVDITAERYRPESLEYEPLVYYDRFRNYYYKTYDLVYRPGYLTHSTKYFFETNLYSLKDGQLMWTGRSRILDPGELDSFLIVYSKGLFKELRLDGLI